MKPETAEKIWNSMTPDERRCWVMMVDAKLGPPECKKALQKAFPVKVQKIVAGKVAVWQKEEARANG